MKVDSVISLYQEAFRKNGDSHASVLWPKDRQDTRLRALLRFLPVVNGSRILDFGCGLGALFDHLTEQGVTVDYLGIDMVQEFLDVCRGKYPEQNFYECIEKLKVDQPEVDFAVASGPFNLLYAESEQAHEAKVQEVLAELFAMARQGIAVNFMSPNVDFKQPQAYHQSIDSLYDFCCENLSRNVVVDQSYMPYEYTVTVMKAEFE